MKQVNKLLNASLLYSLPYVLTILAGLVLVPIFTRYLNPEQYAFLALLASITSVSLTITTLKLDSAIYRFHSHFDTEKEKSDFLGTIFITKLILALFISLLIIGVFGFFHFGGANLFNIPFNPFITATAFIIFFTTISQQQIALWVAEENPKAYTIVSLFGFFMMNGLSILFIIYLNEEAWGKIKAILIVESLLFVFMLFITLKKINFVFSIQYLNRSLKFCLPIFFSGITNDILKNSDRFILAQYAALKLSGVSIGQIGLLHIADKFANMINVPWKGVEKSVTPYIFNASDKDKQKDALIATYKLWIIASGLILLTFLAIIELFFNLFIDEAFLVDTLFISTKLLAISYFFIGSYAFFSIAIGISEKTAVIVKITLLATAINLLLNIFLIPYYGWVIAPISTLLSSMSTHFLLSLASRKIAQIVFPKFFAYKCLGIVVLISLVSANTHVNLDSIFTQALLAIIQCLIYMVIVILIFNVKSILGKIK